VKFHATPLPGVVLVEPRVFEDPRGFFMETYHGPRFAAAGIAQKFVQDNHTRSVRNTLRGLHFQVTHPQGKLVRVVAGEVFDVAVDLRRGAPTFARWHGVRLSAENRMQIYVPPGFAHGFCVLSDAADVIYKCTEVYDPTGDRSIRWDDPTIGIDWPVTDPLLSAKDAAAPTLDAYTGDLFSHAGPEAP
jgi:dTDP-4-dehydrorhamnose 3,5-epimerase